MVLVLPVPELASQYLALYWLLDYLLPSHDLLCLRKSFPSPSPPKESRQPCGEGLVPETLNLAPQGSCLKDQGTYSTDLGNKYDKFIILAI